MTIVGMIGSGIHYAHRIAAPFVGYGGTTAVANACIDIVNHANEDPAGHLTFVAIGGLFAATLALQM